MSYFPKSIVLVPIDFSPPSVKAIQTAMELAETSDGVHVLHVIPTTNPASPAGIWGGPEVDDAFIKKATQSLQQFLNDHGFSGVNARVTAGTPGHDIPVVAKTINADLIVIPSHGETGLTRTLIGSVAERVVRYAECPTLVLRSPSL